MKKIIAMLLALMIVMSLGTTAFAAAMEGELDGGVITIGNAVEGNIYKAYQILFLESYNKDKGVYAYKANTEWADWLAGQTDYVNIDDQGYVTWVEGASAAAFAEAAQTQLNSKSAAGTGIAVADGEGDEKVCTATISNLNLGYYLVDTTLGTLCSLDTTNPTVTMQEKNEVPSITKEVKEDSTGEWGETNDAGIGETVEFKAIITVEKGAINYILHDRMSNGLTYIGVTAVKIGETDVAAAKYTVRDSNTCGVGDCTFEVEFDNNYIKTLDPDTQITVYYTALVNKDAIIRSTGNPNEVDLSYGEKYVPDRTPEDETITYVWDMPVFKYTGDKKTALAGAKFSVYTDEECTKAIKLTDMGNNVYKVDSAGTVTEITTDDTGKFKIEGLDSGTYYVEETEAPAGYNKLKDKVTVVISNKGEVKQNGEIVTEVAIDNKSGTELPDTGGIGTTIFYILGAALMVGAAVLLITKRRMNIAD